MLSALTAGPIDPSDALPFDEKNDLLKPGYLAKENGYCFLTDGSCYVAVLTRMPGVTGDMLDWWFSWHAQESLRYKIWYPGAHAGTSVSISVRLFSDTSPVNRLTNTRFIRKVVIPQSTPRQMSLHCAQEYHNLAQILPFLYQEFGDECLSHSSFPCP